jgi:hypothetical protein
MILFFARYGRNKSGKVNYQGVFRAGVGSILAPVFPPELRIFSILKICKYPRKYANFASGQSYNAYIIPNIYRAILVFRELFWPDPLPTPVF